MPVDALTLHGHTVAYRQEGEGPVVLLIHGIAGCKENWDAVIPALARRCTVLAPDLPGHGASGSSATDYSIGGLAATMRDLLLALGHERATLAGHSLGGGVAMQFAYLFPEHTERLVLVSSGGLGRTVNPLLRSAALPGSELVVAGVGHTAAAVRRVLGPVLGVTGVRVQPDLAEVGRGMASLADGGTRAAFLSTLRAVVGPVGQRVFAGDRLYLAAGMPTLIVWGDRDPIIPVGHGRRAHAAMPGSELVVLEGVGHMPLVEAPDALAEAITRFVADRPPSDGDPERWRGLLRQGA
jgi:pimeloyl-ACP methyl ester carboxylesterase